MGELVGGWRETGLGGTLEWCHPGLARVPGLPEYLLRETLCPDLRSKTTSSAWSRRWKPSLVNGIFTAAKSSAKRFM